MSDLLDHNFKHAMRRLASTIALVTSGKEGNWGGLAATALTSVTADPPTILVAVKRSAGAYPVIAAEGYFCVNVLANRHRDLVGVFSGPEKGPARFQTGSWIASDMGLPMLTDAAANLLCTTSKTVDVGTHTLFIGQVDEVNIHPDIDPLIWVDGKFAAAQVA